MVDDKGRLLKLPELGPPQHECQPAVDEIAEHRNMISGLATQSKPKLNELITRLLRYYFSDFWQEET